MNSKRKFIMWIEAGLAGLALATGMVACGGDSSYGGGSVAGGGASYVPPPVVATTFTTTNLVADNAVPPGHADAHLVNGWGVAFNPNGFAWVANNGTNTSTLYDGNGVPQSLVVTIPNGTGGSASPTGIVFNGSQDFKVSQNGVSGASAFIFAGEGGTVSGWSPAVNANTAVTVVDGGANGPVYKGLAISNASGANRLYAADFRNKVIDVFDANFAKVPLPGGFVDPTLPATYAPFGIQAIADRIYVAYAQQQAGSIDEMAGAGLGIIDVFDGNGVFVKRLAEGGVLNAPWGMAMAPSNFGTLSGDILVGNFGDGKISAFNPTTGAMDGTLNRADGTPIVIEGLWGIAFGNGLNGQPSNTLFFAAGPGDEAHGLYGRIDMQQ